MGRWFPGTNCVDVIDAVRREKECFGRMNVLRFVKAVWVSPFVEPGENLG